MCCSHPCYQPSLFDLAVGLPKSDLFEQLFNLSSYSTVPNKELILTFIMFLIRSPCAPVGEKSSISFQPIMKLACFQHHCLLLGIFI